MGAARNPAALLCFVGASSAVAAVAGAAILLNKTAGVEAVPLTTTLLTLGAAIVLCVAVAATSYALAFRKASGMRAFRASCIGGLLPVLVLLGCAELAVRMLATPTPLGARVGDVALLPNDWTRARQSMQAWLDRIRASNGILDVPDPDLGWDVARGRSSHAGMYATSVEGARSSQAASTIASEPWRYRVALIGDSFTFGEEVPFEHTWGYYLRDLLPAGTQVLNFGVPAHGLDQTLLKYRRDVAPLGPDVVVLSFLSGNPPRNPNMYLFLRPEMELPYAKPRFIIDGNELLLVNAPPLAADAIIAHHTIDDLPFIGEDGSFVPEYWRMSSLRHSYAARYLLSRFPRWPQRPPQHSEEATVALAGKLIEQIAAEVRERDAAPLVVSLPVSADLRGGPTHYRDAVIDHLAERGIEVIEMSECLLSHVPLDELFVDEATRIAMQTNVGIAHYSPRGNAALASCLAPIVSDALQ